MLIVADSPLPAVIKPGYCFVQARIYLLKALYVINLFSGSALCYQVLSLLLVRKDNSFYFPLADKTCQVYLCIPTENKDLRLAQIETVYSVILHLMVTLQLVFVSLVS